MYCFRGSEYHTIDKRYYNMIWHVSSEKYSFFRLTWCIVGYGTSLRLLFEIKECPFYKVFFIHVYIHNNWYQMASWNKYFFACDNDLFVTKYMYIVGWYNKADIQNLVEMMDKWNIELFGTESFTQSTCNLTKICYQNVCTKTNYIIVYILDSKQEFWMGPYLKEQ